MADEQTQTSQSSQTSLSALSDQLAEVVQRASKSIVTIAARPRQTATGFLWKTDTETIVLTADHVVEREDDILVTLPDKREVKAQLIGRDPSSDLAALRLTGVDLGADVVPAEVGENLRVGNLVLVIGRPYADGVRVSFGAVSSIEGPKRSSHGGEIEGVIYADVTMYPGFSGGPLVDLSGRVVGLASSQLTRQSSSALPVATLRRVANTLLTHGRVRRGYLGVGTQQAPISSALAAKAGVAQTSGLLVVTIEPNSPADKAGLLIGDLIIGVAGQPVTDVESLRGSLTPDKLDQAVQIKLLRGGEPTDVAVTIEERK